jgi:hypothetical protein
VIVAGEQFQPVLAQVLAGQFLMLLTAALLGCLGHVTVLVSVALY